MNYKYKPNKNNEYEHTRIPAKGVDIVNVNLVKESSSVYNNRRIANPSGTY